MRKMYKSPPHSCKDSSKPSATRRKMRKVELRETPMKFRPLHDRVVVKRIEAEDMTTGGIIIPDTAKEKPSQGQIIAVGPGGRDQSGPVLPIDGKVGDPGLVGQFAA